MAVSGHFLALRTWAQASITHWILAHRVRARHPTLACDPTAIWDYGFQDINHIEIGLNVNVGAYAEILMRRHSSYSSIPGSLVLEDGCVIGAGSKVRAAGGEIRIGVGAGIGQNCVLIAANHRIIPGTKRFDTPWDEDRTGVIIGANAWIGAGVIILPSVKIGDDVVIAAGSVVTKSVPPQEIWAGVPARKIGEV